MLLSSQSIKKLIKGKKMVDRFIDLEQQLQPSGIDLTVEKVFEMQGNGTIDFDNTERTFPQFREMSFSEEKVILLKKGIYKVRFNEVLKLPNDISAIGRTRSSLLRMGATVETALWDPGFEGKSESLLVVLNDDGLELKKNAKLVQLFFIKLDEKAERVYEGIHKNIK